MVKTVVLLPGFFQGNIPYPNVGKELNRNTISISSIIAIVLLCAKNGQTRQLPFYRHTFVSMTPMGPRARNHIFSLFPLLETDEFLANSATVEDCFGLRPQNTQQYMYSKAHIRGVVTETFPDKDFPWLGFDSESQKVGSDNPAPLADLISQSDELFASLRSAARDLKGSGDCALPEQASVSEVKGVYKKLDNKGLITSWMKNDGFKAPQMLAEGWGTPVEPKMATVESFMCKLRLQGFLQKQEATTRLLIGGNNYPVTAASDPIPVASNPQLIVEVDKMIKDYLAAYRNALGSEVELAKNVTVGGAVPLPTQKMPMRPLVGSVTPELKNKLGDEAISWLNMIDEKMVAYNKEPPGHIIDRQYILEDIQMKVQVLALILAAITGMTPSVIPQVTRNNIPGDPKLEKKVGGARKHKTNKRRPKQKTKTYKSK